MCHFPTLRTDGTFWVSTGKEQLEAMLMMELKIKAQLAWHLLALQLLLSTLELKQEEAIPSWELFLASQFMRGNRQINLQLVNSTWSNYLCKNEWLQGTGKRKDRTNEGLPSHRRAILRLNSDLRNLRWPDRLLQPRSSFWLKFHSSFLIRSTLRLDGG